MTEMIPNDEPGILSPHSAHFNELTPKTGHIWDDTEHGILFLRPAGFTKEPAAGPPRQDVLRGLHKQTQDNGRQDQAFPFHKEDYSICLIAEPSNQYDVHAIRIELAWVDGSAWDIGYIPKRINRTIGRRMDMIKEIQIHSVKAGIHHKYYVADLWIRYRDEPVSINTIAAERFSSLGE